MLIALIGFLNLDTNTTTFSKNSFITFLHLLFAGIRFFFINLVQMFASTFFIWKLKAHPIQL